MDPEIFERLPESYKLLVRFWQEQTQKEAGKREHLETQAGVRAPRRSKNPSRQAK